MASPSPRVPEANLRTLHQITSVTELKKFPQVLLTIEEVAALHRITPGTIRRKLSTNDFRPLPWQKYPYRWLKDDVIRDLETHQPKLKTRRHGFAATKARRLATGNRDK